jgi:hypothetical protein
LFGGVQGNCQQVKIFIPSIHLVFNMATDNLHYHPVVLLDLTVTGRVVRGGACLGNLQNLAECFEEIAFKLATVVRMD